MQTQATKKSAVNAFNFRVVLRGTNSKGKRVRIVATQPAANEGIAAELAASNAKVKAASAKLDNLYITVLPPLVKA